MYRFTNIDHSFYTCMYYIYSTVKLVGEGGELKWKGMRICFSRRFHYFFFAGVFTVASGKSWELNFPKSEYLRKRVKSSEKLFSGFPQNLPEFPQDLFEFPQNSPPAWGKPGKSV